MVKKKTTKRLKMEDKLRIRIKLSKSSITVTKFPTASGKAFPALFTKEKMIRQVRMLR